MANYLHSLVGQLDLPGNIWLVDFPGNGSNTKGIVEGYDFEQWMDLFVPMVQRFERPILVGHSCGAMITFYFPELDGVLKGLVILNSAPSLWLEEAASCAKQFNLPDLTAQMKAFTADPNADTFHALEDACMPYFFPSTSLPQGKALLDPVPYAFLPAVWWQNRVVKTNYSAQWIPQRVPTLIIGSKYDCICPFTIFQKDARFHRSNITMTFIEEGGHFPWVENFAAVQNAFRVFWQTACGLANKSDQ